MDSISLGQKAEKSFYQGLPPPAAFLRIAVFHFEESETHAWILSDLS